MSESTMAGTTFMGAPREKIDWSPRIEYPNVIIAWNV